MDVGVIRGLYTLLLIIVFIGVCLWAYSGRRKADFDDAANLPLEDDDIINEPRSKPNS
jgi:cytochrome c oxidase cbb3-type subunit 4